MRESQLRLYLHDGQLVEAFYIISLTEELVVVNKIRSRWKPFSFSKNWEEDKNTTLSKTILLTDINSVEEISRIEYIREILYMGSIVLFLYVMVIKF